MKKRSCGQSFITDLPTLHDCPCMMKEFRKQLKKMAMLQAPQMFDSISSLQPLDYPKYGVAFLLVLISFGATFRLIRKIADVILALVMFGAIAAVCSNIYNGIISSWWEIVGASVLLGIFACLLCTPLIPFSSAYLEQGKIDSKDGQEPTIKE
jgi:hypothetical protein